MAEFAYGLSASPETILVSMWFQPIFAKIVKRPSRLATPRCSRVFFSFCCNHHYIQQPPPLLNIRPLDHLTVFRIVLAMPNTTNRITVLSMTSVLGNYSYSFFV